MVLAIRGHYEATAVLGFFCDKILAFENGTVTLKEFHDALYEATMSAKHEFLSDAPDPAGILKCCDRADRFIRNVMFAGRDVPKDKAILRDNYEYLSEYAHPNYLSHTGAFRLDKPNSRMILRHNEGLNEKETELVHYATFSDTIFQDFLEFFVDKFNKCFG